MRIRLIHGIHEKEGMTNMSMLLGHMRAACPNSEVSLFQYGFMGFWAARWRNGGVARRLASAANVESDTGPEIWITHSNGAAIAYLAVKRYGAKPTMIVNINPALDRWRTAGVPRVETIHSDQDRAVDLSQFLPFHIWGDQGKVGYRGRHHNTINHNASEFSGAMAYDDHTGLFEPERIVQWALFIAQRIGAFTVQRP